MNKEQMLLDALNRFGNFTSVTQEFSEEQLGVIYELMDMVEQRHKVSGDDTRTEPALPIQNVSVSFCTCEMPAKMKGKNQCWRCKKPFKEFLQTDR